MILNLVFLFHSTVANVRRITRGEYAITYIQGRSRLLGETGSGPIIDYNAHECHNQFN